MSGGELPETLEMAIGQLDEMVACVQQWEQKGYSDRQEHDRRFYPNPGATCSWDCDFVSVCTNMDDGSNFGYIVRNHYEKKPETVKEELNV